LAPPAAQHASQTCQPQNPGRDVPPLGRAPEKNTPKNGVINTVVPKAINQLHVQQGSTCFRFGRPYMVGVALAMFLNAIHSVFACPSGNSSGPAIIRVAEAMTQESRIERSMSDHFLLISGECKCYRSC